MTTARDLAEFVAILSEQPTKPVPGILADDALALSKIARRIKARGIRACNYGHASDEAAERDEKRDDKDYELAQAIADRYNAKVQRMSDVRGFALKLILETGRYNSWGGAESGWGVPE
mgnify:CR=1 FL=1